MKSNVKSIIAIIALIAVIITAVSFLNMNKEDTNPNYSQIISMLENDEITEFNVDGSYVMTYKALVKKLDDNKQPVLDDQGNPVYEVDKNGKLVEREYSFSLQSQFQLEEINTIAKQKYNEYLNGFYGNQEVVEDLVKFLNSNYNGVSFKLFINEIINKNK